MSRKLQVDCCVAGGGPAGVMAGLLFARAGCRTLVLEKHADFLRDFRGDTVHPSTMQVLHELGLLTAFLRRPHQPIRRLSGVFGGRRIMIADFSSLDAAAPFVAMMPQWDFLDFLSGAATRLPPFAIEMQAEVTGLVEAEGRIAGVHAETAHGPLEVRAGLVVGADGRTSTVRREAGLEVDALGAPIDVLWFRVPREAADTEDPLLNTGPGHIVVSLNRGDYYQCALVIPKGAAEAVRARGIADFRAAVLDTAPHLAGGIGAVTGFDDVKLLNVAIDRLRQWSRPGLVMIGDSAHAMSPVGGVGINLAIQDAVAAANLFAGPLADGTLRDGDLGKLRNRRLWPTKVTQYLQVRVQNSILRPILASGDGTPAAPLPLRLVSRMPWLQRRVARLVGLGVRPEHVASPERYRLDGHG